MAYPSECPPPRSLPWLDRLTIISGGTFALLGWMFYGLGMVFFAIFGLQSEAIHLLARGHWEETTGTITAATYTNASENDSPVMRYTYRYAVAGDSLSGQAYTTGARLQEGQTVIVAYRPTQPATSRIPGTRREMFGGLAALVAIFPLIGLGFLFFALRHNLKALDLIVNGHFARGKCLQREATNTQVNNQTVFRYTFGFTAPQDGQTYEVVTRTHQPQLVEDEETERLLYAASDPAHAVMYDTIPHAPPILPDGTLAPLPPHRHLSLILPGLVLLSHVLYIFFRWV